MQQIVFCSLGNWFFLVHTQQNTFVQSYSWNFLIPLNRIFFLRWKVITFSVKNLFLEECKYISAWHTIVPMILRQGDCRPFSFYNNINHNEEWSEAKGRQKIKISKIHKGRSVQTTGKEIVTAQLPFFVLVQGLKCFIMSLFINWDAMFIK